MSTTLPVNTQFRDPFVQSGYVEKLTQAIDRFNGQSAGTIALKTVRKIGDFSYDAFFKNGGSLVSRQDQSIQAPVASTILTQAQIASVKLNRKIGPIEWARSAFLKPGLDMNVFKMTAGEQAAASVLADMLNTGLAAGRTALSNQTLNTVDLSTVTLNTAGLNTGMSKFGDQAARINAFVMHSKTYYDLVAHQIAPANNGSDLAGIVVAAGSPVSFGRPIIVTDSDALFDGVNYFTLGLTADAIVVEETEDMYVAMQEVTGLEQLAMRMQGEFAYNLGVKGFTWDVANGGKNPDAAAIAAAANWDKVLLSHKDLAGFVIKSL